MVSPTCPHCKQSNETVLHTIVKCLNLLDLCLSTNQVLSQVERVQLSTELIKMVPPSSLKEKEKF